MIKSDLLDVRPLYLWRCHACHQGLEVGDTWLRADYFMRNRELGIINTGGDSVVIVDGQEYPLGYSEALYVGHWLAG